MVGVIVIRVFIVSECRRGILKNGVKLVFAKSCGYEGVDWKQINWQNPDFSYIEKSLRKEFVRNYFWVLKLNEEVLAHFHERGPDSSR